jgi:glucan phosphoethanolaminetransferase (alkaline phosphatase superfamily)
MRISRFNFWKITSLILFVLVIFVGMKYFQEYKRNLPYKKELKNFQRFVERTKEESMIFQRQILAQKDPLNLEKEKKDKFGEALEGEKVILISDDLLKSITFPFLVK